MQLINQSLLNDILDVVSQGGPYTDATTGKTVTAVPFSDIAPSLTGNINAGKILASRRRWRNVSDIKAHDLEDSGFTLMVRNDSPNHSRALRGDWKDCRGRRIGQYTVLVTL